jgi:chitodextrinase
MAMGTVVNGGQESTALAVRPVFAFFTYAGQDGGGDPGVLIPHDSKVDNIMTEVRGLETKMQAPVMPTFVFYTVDGSSGDDSIKRDISSGYLQKHYQNLISILQQLEAYRDNGHPVPATILLNPDFFGELHKQCQPGYCPIPLDTPIDVKGELSRALKAMNLNIAVPGDLQGSKQSFPEYVQSINWIMHQFGPDITFGWQDNVWAGDGAGHGWIHKATSDSSQIKTHVKSEVNFLKQMKLVTGNSARDPQYIAFDKWERDVFDAGLGGAGVNNGYMYNAQDMGVYLNYVRYVSEGLGSGSQPLPAMLWQIPGGHLQTTDADEVDQRQNHGSAEPDFILGNPALASGLSNVQGYIADAAMPANIYGSNKATTVRGYMQANLSGEQNSLTKDHLALVSKAHVFAVLWGGGSTTGVAGLSGALDDNGWLFSRIKANKLNNGNGCQSGCDQPVNPDDPGHHDQPPPPPPPSPCGNVVGQSGLPMWCATQDHYNTGDQVEYQSATWKAKWWASEGAVPGVDDVWLQTGGKAPPTDQAWSADKTYDAAGTEVTYQGQKYKNQWWTKGDVPGKAAVWQQQGGGQGPTGIQPWSADETYATPGTEVSYQGKNYQNQWWTKGDVPGKSQVWKQD